MLDQLRCVCVQLPDNAGEVSKFIEKHLRYQALDDALPRVQLGLPAYKGLGGNHNNTFFRMLKQERPMKAYCSIQRDDGAWYLSLQKLAELDQDHADTASRGAPWIVLSRAMLVEEPTAASTIQRAENLVNACVKLPGFLDGIARASKFLDFMNVSDSVLAMTSQMPNLAQDADMLVRTAERLGGKSSPFLKLWLKLSNHFVPSHHTLSKSLLDCVNQLSLSVPIFRVSLFCAAQNCPADFASGGVCMWVKVSDVKLMRKRDDYPVMSELANAGLHERLNKIDIVKSPLEVLMLFSSLLSRVGRHCLGKTHDNFDEYNNLMDIFTKFDEGHHDLTTAPAEGTAPASGPVAATIERIKDRCVPRYGADGKLEDETQLLRDAGLVVNAYVKGQEFDCETNTVGPVVSAHVIDFVDHKIVVQLVGSVHMKRRLALDYAEYNARWSLQHCLEDVIDRGIVTSWEECQSHRKNEWLDHVAKANVTMFLATLAAALWTGNEPPLLLHGKPVKKVFAVNDHPRGTLSLVPLSTNLSVDAVTDANVQNKVGTNVLGSNQQPVWIGPPPTILVPKPGAKNATATLEILWCVRKIPMPTDGSAASDKVNMEWLQYRTRGAMAIRAVGSDDTQASHPESPPLLGSISRYTVWWVATCDYGIHME